MYYSLIGLISIFVHFAINYDILTNSAGFKITQAFKAYRIYLYAILAFFVFDFLWGIFDETGVVMAAYIDTSFYFLAMFFSAFMWLRFTVMYFKEKNIFALILKIVSIVYLVGGTALIIINIFYPVLFSYDSSSYVTKFGRYIVLGLQAVLLLASSVYAIFVSIKYNKKNKFLLIVIFSLLMGIAISIQMFFPLLPLYSVGCIVSVAFLHSFLIDEEKKKLVVKIEESLNREHKQQEELGTARFLAYTDPLTGVKNKHAYVEAEFEYDTLIREKKINRFSVIVFDLNNLKLINDNYGHEKGDKYIIEACNLIKKYFPKSDIFRFGGDEFVIIIDNANYPDRFKLVKDFNQVIDNRIGTKEPIVATGMSDFNPMADNTLRAVFVRADERMYSRKRMLKEMERKSEEL